MALAGLASYGSSSEDEQEEDQEAKMEIVEEEKPQKVSLLPSANDLFDSIEIPSFMGNAKRQAQDIAANLPAKKPATATTLASSAASSSSTQRSSLGGAKPAAAAPRSSSLLSSPAHKHMLPPQVSRPNARNVVTEDTGAWMSRAGLDKAKKKGGQDASSSAAADSNNTKR